MLQKSLCSLLVATSLLAPVDLWACGGCFAPPGAAQVVTDHRMVLSLSAQQTTLWDQFQYSGRTEDFSWILPIRYTDATRVALASDDFLTLLTNVSVPVLSPPPAPPFPPDCAPPDPPWDFGGSVPTDRPSVQDAPSPDIGVTVLREEVVGPYAVVIVHGTSGMGLREWLRSNGYAIPAAVDPVVDYYVGLNLDFVALRLRPGVGLQRMVPVRVTLDGNVPRLPLRMIAAGVADRVGLALMVLAPTRIEAMNFPNATLSNDDFTWDWSAPPTDPATEFIRVFNVRNTAAGRRLWLTESSISQQQATLMSLASRFPRRYGFGADAGMSVVTAEDDVTVAFQSIGAAAVLTRLRADLPALALDRDLELAPSDAAERGIYYNFGRQLHRLMYRACPYPPRVDAGVPNDLGVNAGAPGVSGLDGGSSAPHPALATGGMRCATSPSSSARTAPPGRSWRALWASRAPVAAARRCDAPADDHPPGRGPLGGAILERPCELDPTAHGLPRAARVRGARAARGRLRVVGADRARGVVSCGGGVVGLSRADDVDQHQQDREPCAAV